MIEAAMGLAVTDDTLVRSTKGARIGTVAVVKTVTSLETVVPASSGGAPVKKLTTTVLLGILRTRWSNMSWFTAGITLAGGRQPT